MPDDQQGGNGGGAPAPNPPAAPDQPWYASIQDPEAQGIAALHKWDSPAAAIKSYRELEKLRGVPAERLLTLPEKPDAPEWGQVYDRLGRPAKPEDYELPVPQGYADDFAKVAAPKLHEMGLSKGQAQKLAGWWNEYQQGVISQLEQERSQKSQVELQDLKKEWGGSYKEREELGRRAVREFVVDKGDLEVIEEALGTAKLMKLFANIGSKLGEHKFEGSDSSKSPTYGTSPQEAAARIDQLKSNREWTARLLSGDKEAMAELDRLQRIQVSGMEGR